MVRQDLILDELRRTGVHRHSRLTPRAVGQLREYFADAPVYDDAHVAQTARARGDGLVGAPVANRWCVSGPCALLAPYLLEVALALRPLAEAYLGAPPWLYSANAFWTRPGGPMRPDIQELHRDRDDERFLAMFTYLDPVHDDLDGPHELTGSDGVTRRIYGTEGTIFLADTSHEHRGLPPKRGKRGLHWFRYGVSARPASYDWDGTAPIPASMLGARYPTDPEARRALSPLVTPP